MGEREVTSIKVLRAAGLDDAQIMRVLEAEEAERGKSPKKINGHTIHVSRETGDFDRFWLAYPKRKGSNPKAPARVKFERIIREGVEPLALVAGAKAYAEAEGSNVGTPYIAQAVTWLNQRRWEDYKPVAPKYTPEELAKGREWYARKQAAANG
jgi:hypothetical protein